MFCTRRLTYPYYFSRHSYSAFCAARQDVGTWPPSPSVTGKVGWGIVDGIGCCLLCAGQIRGSDEGARPCQSPLPDVLPSGNSGLGTEGGPQDRLPKGLISLPESGQNGRRQADVPACQGADLRGLRGAAGTLLQSDKLGENSATSPGFETERSGHAYAPWRRTPAAFRTGGRTGRAVPGRRHGL
jgi:hypothetical protein